MCALTTVSTWARGTTGLSSMPQDRCQALRPSPPNRSTKEVSVMEAHVTQGMEAEPVQGDSKVGGYRE